MNGRTILAVSLIAGALLLGLPGSALPQQGAPEWPSQQEERLEQLDAQLLAVQRQRFIAVFGKDKEEAKRLDERFDEIQKERFEMLRATGRM
jgi:septal ring factor EnvC (AmiA/AmiB activator)